MSKEFSLDELVHYLMTTLRTYDVRHVTTDYMNHMSKGAQGLVNLERKKIYMRKSLKDGEHDRVLLHELAHVYYDGLLNKDASEEEVWKLAYAWLQTIYKV